MLLTMQLLLEIASNSTMKKLEVILFYNSTKSGVDTLDRMVRTCTCRRMTRRWPVALSYNMIDDSTVNAFVIGKQLHGKNSSTLIMKKTRNFLIQLGQCFLTFLALVPLKIL